MVKVFVVTKMLYVLKGKQNKTQTKIKQCCKEFL